MLNEGIFFMVTNLGRIERENLDLLIVVNYAHRWLVNNAHSEQLLILAPPGQESAWRCWVRNQLSSVSGPFQLQKETESRVGCQMFI